MAEITEITDIQDLEIDKHYLIRYIVHENSLNVFLGKYLGLKEDDELDFEFVYFCERGIENGDECLNLSNWEGWEEWAEVTPELDVNGLNINYSLILMPAIMANHFKIDDDDDDDDDGAAAAAAGGGKKKSRRSRKSRKSKKSRKSRRTRRTRKYKRI
jgi:hypothetical protein